MQPSTQVVHMPLNGLTESSVRFLVNVAAEALRCVKVMAVSPLSLQLSKIRWFNWHISAKWSGNFAGVAWIEETHRVVVTLETLRRQVGAAVAQRRLGGRSLAAQFADRADVQARATLAACFAGHVERTRNLSIEPPARETDCAGHHLLFAHADAQPALDAGFVLGHETALLDPHRR